MPRTKKHSQNQRRAASRRLMTNLRSQVTKKKQQQGVVRNASGLSFSDAVKIGKILYAQMKENLTDQAHKQMIQDLAAYLHKVPLGCVRGPTPTYPKPLPDHIQGYFQPILTTGDGSCFYNAVSIQIGGTEELKEGLRAVTSHFMAINSEFIKLLPVCMAGDTTPSSVLNMANYAEILEVVFLAFILQANINVYCLAEAGQIRVAPATCCVRELHVLLEGQHYTTLIPIKDVSSVLPHTVRGLPNIRLFQFRNSQTSYSEEQNLAQSKSQSPANRKRRNVSNCESQAQRLKSPTKRRKHNLANSKSQRQRLKSPTKLRKHTLVNSKSQAQRLRSPMKRRKQNLANSKSQRQRLKSPTKRRKHTLINSKSQAQRLRSPMKRRKHTLVNSKSQAQRLRSPMKRRKHNLANSRSQIKRLKFPKHRKQHNKCNVVCQRNRLTNPTSRQRHLSMLRLNQRTRLVQVTARRKHLARLRRAQAKRLQDPVARILHISRVLACKKDAEDVRELAYRKRIYKDFITHKSQGPSHACHSCHRLWFKASIQTRKVLCLDQSTVLAACGDVKGDSVDLCSTCYRSIKTRKIPTLSTQRFELRFPTISKEIAQLTELEERFVCPRIPFMQIRAAVVDEQYLVKGRAVNVPIEVPSAVSVLPRTACDTSVVAICFKRKRSFKHNVAFENVRPAVVRNAAVKLENSPVYRHFNISINLQRLSDNDFQLTASNIPQNNQPDDEVEDEADYGNPVNIDDDETMLQNAIVFAPGEGKKPESLFADFVEAQCFIKVYGGELIQQPKGMSYQQWIKSEIMRDDRRCAYVTKLFFSALKLRVSKMSSSVSFCLRKAKSRNTKFTANQLLDQSVLNDIELHDSGFRVFASDRGAPAYWEKKKKELFAQMRQLGPPTIFLTLSPAETRWPELLVILKKVVDKETINQMQVSDIEYKDRVRLIKSDPVTVARYFEYRMRKLFNLLKMECSIFREHKVIDYYVRTEFQQRGSPHLHCLLWLKDAPVYREGTDNKDVIEFINQFITCSGSLPSELLDLQTHKHTFTCRKGLKTFGKKCRFDIPFFPVKDTIILTPFIDEEVPKEDIAKMKNVRNSIQEKLFELHKNHKVQTIDEILRDFKMTYSEYLAVIRSGLKRVTVFLERCPNDCMVNFYNTELLLLHEANLDIQYITDMYACATYILNYLNKTNSGMSKLLREAAAEIRQGNFTMREQLKMMGNSFLNASEFSAQEAVYYIMGLSLSSCSRQSEFINTSPPENRVAVVKRKADLEKLASYSTDIFTKNVFDHYVQRPTELDDTCVADFVALYNFSTTASRRVQINLEDDDSSGSDCDEEVTCLRLLDKSGYLRRRGKAKIIRFVNYTELDDENFIRENVMLFHHWRNEQDMISSTRETYEKHITDIKKNRAKYVFNENILGLLNEAQEKSVESSESADEETNTPNDLRVFDAADSQVLNQPDEDVDRIAGGHRADTADVEGQPDDVIIPIPKILPENEYSELVSTLNYEQHCFLLHVLHLFKENKLPFYYCVLGGAGVGKSRLINALQQAILRWLNKGAQLDTLKVLLCAPTGKAAFGIKGTTLHSAFALPLNQCAVDIKPLSISTRTSLHCKFNDVGLIIVDEISMVGTKTFQQVDCRLKQIFNSTQPFATKSVILFGDFNQLPPVCDRYVFESHISNTYGELIGNPLWELFSSFRLTEIMRQRDDKQFAMALNDLARGTLTTEQVRLFESRICSQVDVPHGAIRLFKTNASVDSVNSAIIDQDPHKVTVTADDKVTGQPGEKVKENLLKAARKAAKKDTQIPYQLQLSVNIKYMITINVNVEDGLVNGAIGVLKEIDMSAGSRVERLWLQFPSEVGNKRRQELRHPSNADLTAIDRVARSIKPWKSQHSVIRKQFPIVPAEAMTIYKSQGGTYDQVAVSLQRLKRTELYVALSRCTKLSGLYLLGNFIAPPAPSDQDNVVREMKRLTNNTVQMSCLFPAMFPIDITIVYLNIQSLPNASHWADFKNFMRLQKPSMFISGETWTVPHDDLDIDNYNILIRLDCSRIRKAYGTVVHVRHDILAQTSVVNTFTQEGLGNACCFVVIRCGEFYILSGYKPPTTPLHLVKSFICEAAEFAQQNHKKLIILGDFNIDIYHPFLKQLETLGFRNQLNAGTSTTNNNTGIDCAWANFDFLCGVVETLYSHHKCVMAIPTKK